MLLICLVCVLTFKFLINKVKDSHLDNSFTELLFRGCRLIWRFGQSQSGLEVWKWYHQMNEGGVQKSAADVHQMFKCSKIICGEFGLHQTTVRQIVYKWKKFKSTVPQTRRVSNKDQNKSSPRGHSNGEHGTTTLLSNKNIPAHLQLDRDIRTNQKTPWKMVYGQMGPIRRTEFKTNVLIQMGL